MATDPRDVKDQFQDEQANLKEILARKRQAWSQEEKAAIAHQRTQFRSVREELKWKSKLGEVTKIQRRAELKDAKTLFKTESTDTRKLHKEKLTQYKEQHKVYKQQLKERYRGELVEAKILHRHHQKEARETERLYKRLGLVAPGAPGAGGTGRAGGAGHGGGQAPPGRARRALGALGGAAAFAGGGIVGMLYGAMARGFGTYTGTQQSMGSGIGLGIGSLGGNANRQGRGGNLGYNIQERAGISEMMARSTGSSRGRSMMTAMRASGMGEGETASVFKTMREGGATFGKGNKIGTGEKEFAKFQAAAIAAKLPKALAPEFISGIEGFMRTQKGSTAGAISGEGIAKLAAALSRSGQPGMQGERGFDLLRQVDQGLRNPGGGDEGMAQARQMFGYGMPGSNVSFYQAEKMREQGLMGKGGTASPEIFQKVMDTLKQLHPDTQGRAIAMRGQFGTTLDQGEALIKISESNADMGEKMKKVQETMDKGKSLEAQSQEAMKESKTILADIAKKFDLSYKIGQDSYHTFHAIEEAQTKLVMYVMEWVPKLFEEWKELILVVKQGINAIVPGGVFDIDGEEKAKAAQAGKQSAMVDPYATPGDVQGQNARLAMAKRKSVTNEEAREIGQKNYQDVLAKTYLNARNPGVGPKPIPTPDELKASNQAAKAAIHNAKQYQTTPEEFVKKMATQSVQDTLEGKRPAELLQQLVDIEQAKARKRPDAGAAMNTGAPTGRVAGRADATGRH